MKRPSVPLTWVLALLLIGCGRVDFEWQGPTGNFPVLDANADGDVDRFEWEQVHGSTFDSSGSFRYSDCDSDGRMSWHEYFVGYMRMRHCQGGYLYEPPPPPPTASRPDAVYAFGEDTWPDNWRQGTLLVRPEENLQIYEQLPQGPDLPSLLRPSLRPPPARYSEEDLSPAEQQNLQLTSSQLADAVLVAHYDPAEKFPGNEARAAYPHLNCEIGNHNSQVRITMADIEVVWHSGGRETRERWVKPVWIAPGGTQHIDVWFGGAVDDAKCHLLDARGQRLRKVSNIGQDGVSAPG